MRIEYSKPAKGFWLVSNNIKKQISMSHFKVIVIGDDVEGQLKNYDENLAVRRYVRYTKEQLIAKEKDFIERYKNTIYAKYLENPEEYAKNSSQPHLDYLEKKFPLKLKWSDEEIYDYAISDYNDGEIGPNGEVYSTYNPKSKWDWWVVGGRWTGELKIKKGASYKEPRGHWGIPEEELNKLIKERKTDQGLAKDIENLSEQTTFFVLKDGEWFEKGEMGWWGVVSNEKDQDEWDNKVKELLSGLDKDTLITIVDCHI